MKSKPKSSITLPASEVRAVEKLRRRLGAPTKVAVVRRALRLLEETTDREQLRRGYLEASLKTCASTGTELAELDALAGEGIDECPSAAATSALLTSRRGSARKRARSGPSS